MLQQSLQVSFKHFFLPHALPGTHVFRKRRPIPVALGLSLFPQQEMTGSKQSDSFDKGARFPDRPECEIAIHSFPANTGRNELGGENAAHFGSKDEGARQSRVIKWLDAYGVACHKQVLMFTIPDCKCKDALKLLQALLSPAGVGFKYNLRV